MQEQQESVAGRLGGRQSYLETPHLVVVKLGSAVLTDAQGRLDGEFFSRFATEISLLIGSGYRFVIVTSGAVAAGREVLGYRQAPATIPEKQACAAVGQVRLMWQYEQAFAAHRQIVGQVLLTGDDIYNRRRYLNARHTITTLLQKGVIPIVNENDTVVVREIKFGDNDNLAALLTSLAEVDLLIMLTDIDGFYAEDPKVNPGADLISMVSEVDSDIESLASLTKSSLGSGGMVGKLQGVKKAAAYGIPSVIANGKRAGVVTRILAGDQEGTLFLPRQNRLTCRKHWLAYAVQPRGVLTLDPGAVRALVNGGKSLLSSGIIGVEGSFGVGEPVSCCDEGGREIARGLVNYAAEEISKLRGSHSRDIEAVLGYCSVDEIIHRDNLVVLAEQ
ncbi:MAG: glutamate 5-kinase [Deltaproteobacteria bacterium]|nr:glutamate 5-kinase [Candidatus Anaeroferrophillus wilburensis]MBN2889236.1 glutamate 5-kinase [Deltaproteobacteria bacterium]